MTTPSQWRAAANELRRFAAQWDELAVDSATELETALRMHQVQFERANRLEEAIAAISGYLYKRSKYGDEEADEILRQWYPEATP